MYIVYGMYVYCILYIGKDMCRYLLTTRPKSFSDTFKLLSPLCYKHIVHNMCIVERATVYSF